MKNIHLIPTCKPSRLHLAYNKNYYLSIEPFVQLDTKNYKSFNVYITNDEETKEGDWCYYENGDLKGIHKVVNGQRPKTMILKKIILTTDGYLINDGIQAIDDIFLKWFVKNPTCESVEVKIEFIQTPDNLKDGFYYKIIIPTEKPKSPNMKKKTIEEAAERYQETTVASFAEESFKAGAEWYAKNQSEQMYSEEEVNHYVNDVMGGCNLKADEWFIQFKLLNNKN